MDAPCKRPARLITSAVSSSPNVQPRLRLFWTAPVKAQRAFVATRFWIVTAVFSALVRKSTPATRTASASFIRSAPKCTFCAQTPTSITSGCRCAHYSCCNIPHAEHNTDVILHVALHAIG
eukprot:2698088-Rhodomonas_salina.5